MVAEVARCWRAMALVQPCRVQLMLLRHLQALALLELLELVQLQALEVLVLMLLLDQPRRRDWILSKRG